MKSQSPTSLLPSSEVPADPHGHLGSRHAGPVGCHRATVAVAPAGLRGRLRGGSGLETWEGLSVERWAGKVGRNWIGFVLFCRKNKARPAWNWKMWFDLLVEGLRFTMIYSFYPAYSAKNFRIGSHSVVRKNTVFRHLKRPKAPPTAPPTATKESSQSTFRPNH